MHSNVSIGHFTKLEVVFDAKSIKTRLIMT